MFPELCSLACGRQGYNGAIIAYGQTGTGKTYTMEGAHTGPDRGIIPRAVEDIFACIEHDAAPGSKYLVRASYLQIYNEVRSPLPGTQEPRRCGQLGCPQQAVWTGTSTLTTFFAPTC